MNRDKEIGQLVAEIQQRKLKTKKGYLFAFLALLALLDVPFPPLPPMIAVMVFAGFFVLSLSNLREGSYLPVTQCLKLSKFHHNKLSVSIITMELGISIPEAKKSLHVLCNEGLAVISDKSVNEGDVIYDITGLDENTELSETEECAAEDTVEKAGYSELIDIKKRLEERKSERGREE